MDKDWLARCQDWKRRYPVVLDSYWHTTSGVNPYCFGAALFHELAEDAIVVSGDGTACIVLFQTAYTKPGQRHFTDSGCAPMGFDLPAAIGAHYASGKPVVCLAGDGSIMLNVQELQTIRGARLPIKIFVLNNGGYHSIRQTQANFFPGTEVGCGPESGVSFPDFYRLAGGFDIPFRKVSTHAALPETIRATLAADGPQMCEVVLDKSQPFAPRSASRALPDGRIVSAPLEDMHPFLPRDELAANMIVPEVSE